MSPFTCEFVRFEALALDGTGAFDVFADFGGGFVETVASEFFKFDARDGDLNVNALEERTRNALLIAGDHGGRAGALFDRVADW